MNNSIVYTEQGNKECAGKGCSNAGLYLLRIKYIKKDGWFCYSCKNILFRQGLIEGESGQEVTN